MAVYQQTAVADAIAHQHVTHQNSVYGADIIASAGFTAGALWAYIHMFHGFTEAASNADPGSFYVQTSLEGAGVDDAWANVAIFPATIVTPSDEALDAQEVAGTSVLAVTATAGFVANDLIYITDSSADNLSEWHQIDIIDTNVSINLVDDLDNQKEIGDTIFSDAEHFTFPLDLSGIAKWRVIFKHEGTTGANVAIRARFIEVAAFA